MKMQMTGHMRQEQRMKLAPKMIQSMEILQMALPALEEKIEAELNSNPVLELNEPQNDENAVQPDEVEADPVEKDLVVSEDNDKVDEFERLANVDFDYQDYMDRGSSYQRSTRNSSEPDKKLEAMNNTAARQQSLHDCLLEQWRLVEAEPEVMEAGRLIIDFIDEKGYLSVRLEQLHNKDKNNFGIEHLRSAIVFVQTLEPVGVGARDLKECLLIQLKQRSGNFKFEIRLVRDHLRELLDNRIPNIADSMGCSIEEINDGISRLKRLDTSPGLQVGRQDNPPVSTDIIIESDGQGGYTVRHADEKIPSLRINSAYMEMARNRNVETQTRQFLQLNIRNARWLMEAIAQRQNTLLRVSMAIVKHQKEFFDKGRLHLKPLPMSKIAGEVGVHVATVSRAVSGKYVQCSQGIVSLRSFFSGGTNDNGDAHSWNAIRAKMQEIIDSEDKSNPLNDDQIREKLEQAGLGKIARRTVAKYRNLMKIPSGRYRKRF